MFQLSDAEAAEETRCVFISSRITLPGERLSGGGAGDAEGAGEERRDVRDDGYQRAG